MKDAIDLMSDRMVKQLADLTEKLEETGKYEPGTASSTAQKKLFGNILRACIYFRRSNMSHTSRRLGFESGAIRELLDGDEENPELMKTLCNDKSIGLSDWLEDIRDNCEYFITIIENARISGAIE